MTQASRGIMEIIGWIVMTNLYLGFCVIMLYHAKMYIMQYLDYKKWEAKIHA